MYNFNLINVPLSEYSDDSTYKNNFIPKMKKSYSYNNIPSAMGDEQIKGVWDKMKEEELNRLIPLSSEDEEGDDQHGDKISRFFISSSDEDENEERDEEEEEARNEAEDENDSRTTRRDGEEPDGAEEEEEKDDVGTWFIKSDDEEEEEEEARNEAEGEDEKAANEKNTVGTWFIKSDDEEEIIHPERWLNPRIYNGNDDKTAVKEQDEITYPAYAKECLDLIEENLTPKEIYEKYLKNQLDYMQLLKNVMERIKNIQYKRLIINNIIGFPCCEYVFKNISFHNSLYESFLRGGYILVMHHIDELFPYKKIVYREILFRIIQCYHKEITTDDLINYIVDSIKNDYNFIIYCVVFMVTRTKNNNIKNKQFIDFLAVVYIVLLKAFKRMGYNGLCRYILSITKEHKLHIAFTEFNLSLCLQLLHYSEDATPFYSILEPDDEEWDVSIMCGFYKEICDRYEKEEHDNYYLFHKYDDKTYYKKKRFIRRIKSYVDNLNILSVLDDDETLNKSLYKEMLIKCPYLKSHNEKRAMLSKSLMEFLASKDNHLPTLNTTEFYRQTLKKIVLNNREYVL